MTRQDDGVNVPVNTKHGHFSKICKVCRKVVLTCRCFVGGKNITYLTCDKCKDK